jgi:hypothetical protein
VFAKNAKSFVNFAPLRLNRFIMKKTKIIFICVISVALLFGAWKLYNGFYFEKGKRPITLKCHYMAYACGDCYPQWRVDSSFAIEKDLRELIGKDIYVERKGVVLEELITDSASKCMICYDFYLNGSLKRTLSNKYKFDLDSFEMELRFKDCCN